MRRQKAVEYGAILAEDLNPNVTHVIVDKHIPLKDVLRALKIDVFPVSLLSTILGKC